MAPKIKVNREAIVEVALEIVRQDGVQALNARMVAAKLGCSTQPVFSNFASMEELKQAVIGRADALCNRYRQQEVDRGEYPEYKAHGMAYIRFAMEERELFKLLYMRDRTGEMIPEVLDPSMEELVQNRLGVDAQGARLFHLEMWAYVHGIATMVATGFGVPDWELVSKMLTDAYLGLRTQYEKE